VIRFPKGVLPQDIPAIAREGEVDVLARDDDAQVLIVAVGGLAGLSLEVAKRLADQGIATTVVDPRWVKPIDPALVTMSKRHRLVVTVEDGVRVGGVGSTLAQAMRDEQIATPVQNFGVPLAFMDHGKRAEVLADCGLTAQDIARSVAERFSAMGVITSEPAVDLSDR